MNSSSDRHHDSPSPYRASSSRTNKQDEVDDSYGFGCGRWNQGFDGFGCGGLRNNDARDPFGVFSRVRAMVQEKFSSRVDFSEEVEPSRARRMTVNFVEHRI